MIINKNLLSALFVSSLFTLVQSCQSIIEQEPLPKGLEGTATKFFNPVLPTGSDPWVYFKDGYYYVMTSPAIGPRNLFIWKTKKMSDLRNTSPVKVWSAPATGPN